MFCWLGKNDDVLYLLVLDESVDPEAVTAG